MEFLFIASMAVILTGLGWALTAKLDSQGGLTQLERAALGFCLGALLLHLAVFAIGHWRLDVVSMGLIAGGLTLASLPGLRAMPWRQWWGAGLETCAQNRRRPFAVVLVALTCAVGLSSLLQGMAPPNDYDSLMYHLSIPLHDVALGRMEIAWGWHNRNFFPILIENLARFSIVLSGQGAAQMVHGLFGIAGAMLCGALARRVGGSILVAWAAGLFFLSIRTIVWEMATVQVEVAQAAYAVAALIVYMQLRETNRLGLALVFGLMIAGGLHVKYTSMLYAAAFAPIMAWDLFRRKVSPAPFLLGPAIAVVVCLPHVFRNLYHTGNPVFPLLNPLFNPGAPSFMEELRQQYGIGRDVFSHFIAPWAFSVDPMRHFDGMVLGGPYLLALAPFALFGLRRVPAVIPVVVVSAGFYVAWFHLISQQVRFLAPIFPALATFAAIGAAVLWRAAGASRPLRLGVAGCFLILGLTQAMFVGIYSALRLPSALGIQSDVDYLTRTPTMDGSHYLACRYVSEHLKPGERYLSLLAPHFSTCPPNSAVIWLPGDEKAWMTGEPPKRSAAEVLERLDAVDIRLVIVQTRFENRRNDDARPDQLTIDLSGHAVGAHLQDSLDEMTPLLSDRFADVYDGVEMRERLRRRIGAGG